jgi:uncharacterized protein with ATP-grasp and redox domains
LKTRCNSKGDPMKLHPECVPCMVKFAHRHAELATDDLDIQLRALSAALEFLAKNVSREVVPAILGTRRDQIIREITSNPDPFAKHKRLCNEIAAKLVDDVKPILRGARDEGARLRSALKIAVVGNSMEFGFMAPSSNVMALRKEFRGLLARELSHDDLEAMVSKILDSEEVLYLTDNAGEIIFDKLLIEELKRAGVEPLVAAKASPVQDDVTIAEARALGIHRIAKLLSQVIRSASI